MYWYFSSYTIRSNLPILCVSVSISKTFKVSIIELVYSYKTLVCIYQSHQYVVLESSSIWMSRLVSILNIALQTFFLLPFLCMELSLA